MPKQKLTHEIEWEPITGAYRILKITGSQRQPTIAEAHEYIYENNLPEEIWVAAFTIAEIGVSGRKKRRSNSVSIRL